MSKYRMDNDSDSTHSMASQVTLTSYLAGNNITSDSNNESSCPNQKSDVNGSLKTNDKVQCCNNEQTNNERSSNDMLGRDNPAFAHSPSDPPPPFNNNNIRKNTVSTILHLPDEKYMQYRNRFNSNARKENFKDWIKERTQRGCTRKVLYKRLPILSWLPEYKTEYILPDMVAGVTVGLTVIPQAIAYASIAGIPPQYGLYSGFMCNFAYTLFGSIKDSSMGPTAISGLLTRENIHGLGPPAAILLTFLTGCVQFLMGILQLGFLIDFISGPVSIGFTSAVAIIIASTQVKDLLGINASGNKFLEVWQEIFHHIPETSTWDLVLGIVSIIVLLALRKVKDIRIGPDDEKQQRPYHSLFNKTMWMLSSSRNLLVVVFSSFLAYYCELHESKPFKLTGFVKPGMPDFKPPPFEMPGHDNATYEFFDMVSTYGSGILVVPILGILENIALAKVFCEGKSIDASQEMIALGACNIATSFVQGMPVTGALSRGAVNNASGVKTTFGSVYTGITVILALYLLTPCFAYIPKASLAAVIIAAVVFMVELHVFKPIWRTKKIDIIPASATFICCLFLRLELGIVIGIAINLIFLLYHTARPSLHVEKLRTPSGCDYLLIIPDRSLTFPSVDYVRYTILKAGLKQGSSTIPVVIDARHIQGADYTVAKGIKMLIEDFYKRHQPILFYNLKPSVVSTFQGVDPKDFVYCNSFDELNDILKQYSVNSEEKIEIAT